MTKQPTKSLGFQYRWGDTAQQEARVWRDDWAGDMFEVLDRDDFYVFMAMCKRFSLLLIEAED